MPTEKTLTNTSLAPTNILLVDDNPNNLMSLQAILERPEYNLLPANSGREALKILEEHEVAVVVLDVMMPVLDGFETAALIRGRYQTRNLPIIFLTAQMTDESHVSRGYTLGAVDYITKPVEPEVLQAKIRRLVELFINGKALQSQLDVLYGHDEIAILLVNDNPEALMALESTLQHLGARIVTAGSADQALRLLLRQEFALLLIDVNMPGTNGFALAGIIRQRLELRDVPIIFMSATAKASEDVLRGYAVGGADFIFLPCPPEFIQAKVGAFLDLVKMSRVMSRQVRKNEQLNSELLASNRQLEERIIESDAAQLALSKSEQALRLAHDELEVRVQERTEALVEKEAQFRNLVETTSDWIWEVDENALYTYTNPRIYDLLGYLPEEVIGKTPFDLMSAEEAQRTAKLFRDSASARQSLVNFENINLHKDGHQVILETSAVPIIDQKGNYRGYRGIDRDITERKQAEEELARLNLALQTMLASNQAVLHIKDEQQLMAEICRVMVEVGGYCLAWVGLAEEDKSVRLVASYGADGAYLDTLHITWDETATGRGPTGKAIRQGIPVTCSNVETDPDYGPWRKRAQRFGFASTLALPLRLGGEVIGALNIYAMTPDAFSEDVIELLTRATDDLDYGIVNLRAEIEYESGRAEVQRLEQRNTLILNAMGEGIFGLDLEGRATFINPAAMAMLQWTEQELLGRNAHDLHHHTKADGTPYPRGECAIAAACRDGVVHQSANEIFWRKDGTNFPVEYISTPIRDEQGEIRGAVVSFTDITKRLAQEEENRRLITAIEQGADTIIITDRQGAIQYVNPAFTTTTGYTREEATGRNPRLLKSGEQDASFYQKMWQTLTSGKVWKGRLVNKKKDGTLFDEEVTISPVLNEKREIINYVAVKRDVSEQVRLGRQLRQAQKMEAIGTLAGGIAHDFNNILSAILGFSELAMRKLTDQSPEKEDLQEVINAGKRATELVKQILTFSRQAEHTLFPLTLQPVIKEALKLLRSSLPTTIEIEQDINPGCGKVLADPTQIHQIIMNLCTNAYHAMREKGGVLRVSFAPAATVPMEQLVPEGGARPPGYVKLEISDTGMGIKPAMLEKIFEPYFTTKGVGEGTGLGLSVVHGIVKSHGGQIEVDSQPGKGSTFSVYLPLAQVEVAEGPAAEAEEPVPGGNERILVVEDEETIRDITRRTLEGFGYQVTTAANGGEAVQLFQKEPQAFDLVITDMTMPKMTGLEMARRLVAIRPDLPIILCTGYSSLVNEETAKKNGIREFLMKPVALKDLGRAVRRVMDGPPGD